VSIFWSTTPLNFSKINRAVAIISSTLWITHTMHIKTTPFLCLLTNFNFDPDALLSANHGRNWFIEMPPARWTSACRWSSGRRPSTTTATSAPCPTAPSSAPSLAPCSPGAYPTKSYKYL
jgi:hypothetical protein